MAVRSICLAALLSLPLATFAQNAPQPPVQPTTQPAAKPQERPLVPTPSRRYQSHQVNPDHTITFRLDAPNAKSVSVVTDATATLLPMVKGDDGLWAVTTPPLKPELYGYAFVTDGVEGPDPHNSWTKPNLVTNASMVMMPASPAAPWEATGVPHGTLHTQVYTTEVVQGLPGHQSRYVVYTPPGYDPKAVDAYPVLYLLHGWSDSEGGWSQIGQADLILDSLIAAGKAQPMVVVMPLGYGQMSFVENGFAVWQDAAQVKANVDGFQKALLGEVMPQVEAAYHVRRDRDGRAIAGLSMGGLESLSIGLTHTSQFAWVGGLSSALMDNSPDWKAQWIAAATTGQVKLRLLWIACGTEDPLLKPNREFISTLKQAGLPVTAVETPGGHAWPVWRDDLVRLAPLLFHYAGQ